MKEEVLNQQPISNDNTNFLISVIDIPDLVAPTEEFKKLAIEDIALKEKPCGSNVINITELINTKGSL